MLAYLTFLLCRPLVNLSEDDDDNVRAPIAPIQGPIVEQTFQQTYGNFFKNGIN